MYRPFRWGGNLHVRGMTLKHSMDKAKQEGTLAQAELNRANFSRYFRLGRMPLISIGFVLVMTVMHALVESYAKEMTLLEVVTLLGAKSRPRIIEDGQSWRILSANFIHKNWHHLFMNAFAFLNVGSVLENVYRRGDYLLLLLISCVGAMLSSFIFLPEQSVGASGMVFGCLGAAIVFGFRFRDVLPKKYKSYFGAIIVGYALTVFLVGFMLGDTDNWGHVGGFIVGTVMGSILVPNLMRFKTRRDPFLLRAAPYALSLILIGCVMGLGPILQNAYAGVQQRNFAPAGIDILWPRSWLEMENRQESWTIGNGENAIFHVQCFEKKGDEDVTAFSARFLMDELKAGGTRFQAQTEIVAGRYDAQVTWLERGEGVAVDLTLNGRYTDFESQLIFFERVDRHCLLLQGLGFTATKKTRSQLTELLHAISRQRPHFTM